MVAFCYYLGTKKIKTMKTEKTRQKKKNRNKIVFGNDVQDKMIISISCLVIVDKIK
jgi:hypothetical protein